MGSIQLANNPDDDNYSILGALSDSERGTDGKFHFKLSWPQNANVPDQEWKQHSNPVLVTSTTVSHA